MERRLKRQYVHNSYLYSSLGMVVTTSPTCSLYSIVVLPAPSRPKINTLNSFDPHRLEKRLEKKLPVIIGGEHVILPFRVLLDSLTHPPFDAYTSHLLQTVALVNVS